MDKYEFKVDIYSCSEKLNKKISSAIRKINRQKWCHCSINTVFLEESNQEELVVKIVAQRVEKEGNKPHICRVFLNEIYQYIVDDKNIDRDINLSIRINNIQIKRSKIKK